MARSQALEVQEKRELVSKEEKTVPSRYFVPTTDIFETEDALTVVMEIPGVAKPDVDVNIENDILRVEARIEHSNHPVVHVVQQDRPTTDQRAAG